MTIGLYSLAAILLTVSFFKDRSKSKKALKAAFKMLKNMLPLLLVTLSIVSVVLFLFPDYVIAKYLGANGIFTGSVVAALIGSISLIPGFITFPLCGLLLKKGVSYMVLASFSTTLMMVGIVTFPLEKKYFGTKLTIIRNAIGFLIAIIVAVVIGIFYGEVF